MPAQREGPYGRECPHLGGRDLEVENSQNVALSFIPIVGDKGGQRVGWGEEHCLELPEGTSPSMFPLPGQ